MTKEESTPDFEHLLQAPNSAEFPASQPASPPSVPSRIENNTNTVKKETQEEFRMDALQNEHNGILEEDDKLASAKTTPNHLLENGDCKGTPVDTNDSEASNNHMDTIVKDNETIVPPKMGSSHKRKSKPVKLQKTRRKSTLGQSFSIPQPKQIAPAQSPVTACSPPVSLATTETMIKSIPDMFKNASIGTETPLPVVNGPLASRAFVKDADACAEPSDDITSQISVSVLPPFAPPLPPERFNMPASDQQHWCLDCGDQFWVESSLTQHLQRRSIYITFNCATCKKLLVFYNRCTLLGHVRAHHDRSQPADIQQASISPLPHELIQCIQDQKLAGSTASSPKASSTPMVTIIIPPNSDNILTVTKPNQKSASKCKCPECHYQCGSFLGLQEHLGCSQTSPAESSAQCPQCNMMCPSRCSLLCHQRIHVQSKPYLCPECGQNVADKWDDFQRHLAIECMHYSRTIGFRCPACELLVVTPEQLRQHVISSHSEFYYKCQACPMAFRAEATFDAHRKTVHLMENLHCTTIRKCPLCEVVFQSSDVLQNHLESHFQEALKASKFLFMCLECNQLFEEKPHLGQHLQSNHGALFGKGNTEDPTNKRRLKPPRKRPHPADKPKTPSTKAPQAAIPKLTVQKTELLKDKAINPKVFKSKLLKPKPSKSCDSTTGESSGEALRREPRIPPLVLSLKDHGSSSEQSPLIVKKAKMHQNPSGANMCEDCGRTFTTLIGCRVHRQRSHMANYKFKKQFRLTLERRSRRPVQERIQAYKSAGKESAKSGEGTQGTKSSVEGAVQGTKSNIPAESKDRPATRRSSSAGSTTCEECGRNFQSSKGCSVHRHHCHEGQDDVKSKCAVCHESHQDPHSMAEHGQKHLKAGMLVCTLCNNLVFSTKLALSKHIENHAYNMPYPATCALCNEELVSADPAIEHWRKEHGMMSFHCPKCDAQYLYKKSLNRHILASHGATRRKQEYKCLLCDVDAFLTSALLKKHMAEDHCIPRKPQEAGPEISRDTNTSTSETQVMVKTEPVSPEAAHVDNEREMKPEKEKDSDCEYLCAKCDFRASDRDVFQSHITVHKTESDSYQCLECGTSFMVEPSLRKHLTCTHKVKDLETFMLERSYTIASTINNGDENDGGRPSIANSSNGGQSDGGKTNPLECPVCFLSLENELALKIHSRTHGMAFIRSKRNTCMNSQSSEQSSPSTTPTKNET